MNKIEANIIQKMEKNKIEKITLNECIDEKNKEEIMCFLSSIKHFKTLRRNYAYGTTGVITFFEK
ncbi:hypothetical protein [Enterococcus faecium]|uniref:hypothetical protein n=1 Tax=Enterococcus faecium TaxID=1352 RepID=UPI0033931A2F